MENKHDNNEPKQTNGVSDATQVALPTPTKGSNSNAREKAPQTPQTPETPKSPKSPKSLTCTSSPHTPPVPTKLDFEGKGSRAKRDMLLLPPAGEAACGVKSSGFGGKINPLRANKPFKCPTPERRFTGKLALSKEEPKMAFQPTVLFPRKDKVNELTTQSNTASWKSKCGCEGEDFIAKNANKWREWLDVRWIRKGFSSSTYMKLCGMNLDTSFLPAITEDVERHCTTLCTTPTAEWKSKLVRVLHAFTMYSPRTGYQQGMINITCFLMLHLHSEQDTFWGFVQIMYSKRYNLDDYFCSPHSMLNEHLRWLDFALSIHRSQLHTFLVGKKLHPSQYATQWLLNLYTGNFPHSFSVLVWGYFIEKGVTVLIQVALALLTQFQNEIMSLESRRDVLALLAGISEVPDDVAHLSQLIHLEDLVDLSAMVPDSPNPSMRRTKSKSGASVSISRSESHTHSQSHSKSRSANGGGGRSSSRHLRRTRTRSDEDRDHSVMNAFSATFAAVTPTGNFGAFRHVFSPSVYKSNGSKQSRSHASPTPTRSRSPSSSLL